MAGSANWKRRIPLRTTHLKASRITSSSHGCHAMKRMPVVMKLRSVVGVAARISRISSHGILAVEADRDGHVRARREVERMEADPLHHGSDGERLARGEPGRAPEALVPVPRGRVDDLDRPDAVRRHAGSTRNSG